MFDRWRALSTRNQLLLVALVAALFCALTVFVWYGVLDIAYQPAFTELRPSDAAAIVADLERKKIPYRLADGGATVMVPADMVDRTRLDVVNGDVPLKGTIGFELFDKSDMGLTDFAQKINYQRALQGELERTIASLDGIDSARVHLSLGEDRIFRDDGVPPKAAVTVRMQKGAALTQATALGIQHLVAAAVPNLEVANVVILDEKGEVVGADSPGTAAPAPEAPEAEATHAIEQYYVALVRGALEHSYPLSNMVVSVTAGAPVPDASAGGAPQWNPIQRNFPLAVTVQSPAPLDAGTRETVKSLVASAIGFETAKNDAIDFGVATGEAPPLPPRPRHHAPLMAPPAEIQPPGGIDVAQPLAVVAAVVLLLIGGFVLVWRLLRPRRLSEAQRADYAARLRAAFAEGDGHAAT